jgi:hypothetical protein
VATHGGQDGLATRFHIVQTRWTSSLYEIHLGETIIPIRNPPIARQLKSRERMAFTWPDGDQYTVTGPNPPHGAIEIVPPEARIWSGLPVVSPRLRDELGRPAISFWRTEDRIMTCDNI